MPRIRFKGFEGEWDEVSLEGLFPITSAARVHKHEWTQSGVPFFRSSDVVSAFKGEKNAKAFISHDLYEKLSAKVGRIKAGDVLVTGGGSIGVPYLVENDDPLYFKDADLLWFKVRGSIDSHYLHTYLGAQPFRKHLQSISHIGTIAHYTVEQAKATPITVSKVTAEQTQIGGYFREVDRLIGLQQRKHDKLVTLKKAMLQKMFPQPGTTTPEIRFKGFEGEWEEKKLGEIIDLGSGRDYKHLSAGNIPVYGTGGYMLSVNEALSSISDAIGIGRKGTIDKPYILKAPFWTVDTLFYAIPRFGNDLDFVFCIFQGMDWKKKNEATGVPSLSKVAINEIGVVSPSPAEQQKIGRYFRTLDELISKHAIQLRKLKQLKSACLERMFV
ncbi:restriction endonuclease subunit S [Luteolibacter pohnpeiensis]|uniref:Restriction endonuclease subunit S n=1 Tax=Luteolibacter pohnpeiensis TaxID=454153 RepID=A0A934SCG5_9BACT|nr:restriction endonuclease subunit S [Luteolibacter pohnpeiensis]MBK1883359.1 restriction endonuclease subunit S [Luteolibacter pohnpeiensis]